MKCFSKLYRSLFNALPLALSFAAGTALAVDLPANYTRLDWIESDATNQQWIDSGYSPNTATIINVSLLARSPKDAWAVFFGVIEGSTSATSVRFRYDANSHLQGLFGNSTAADGQVDSVKDGEYQIELRSGRFTITRAGSDPESKQLTSGTTIVNAPMYIFCQNEYTSATGKSAPSRYQPMRLYSMTISEGNELKRDFIPCMDDKGICGLWDNVEGKFYANKGSGAGFTGGAKDSAVELEVANASNAGGVNVIVRKIAESDVSATFALPIVHMIDSLTIEGGVTISLESGIVGAIEGAGTIVVSGSVQYATISSGIDVRVESTGRLTSVFNGDLKSVFGNLPALWLDASDETTFQEYTYNGHTVPDGTFPGIVVRRWNDVRGGEGRYYAVNARASTGNSNGGYIRTMPYSITNELNGLTVLSFGTRGNSVSGAPDQIKTDGTADNHTGNEERRMIFNKPIVQKTIIMVYGSQDGGGMALVGGWKSGQGEDMYLLDDESIDSFAEGQETYYNRNNATVESTTIAARRKNVPCWVNGTSIVPNETAALNGGYQIISLGVAPGVNPSVRSLGMSDERQNAGGQRYGEILIFTNELTAVQRSVAEVNLARKWGLESNYSNYESVVCSRPKSLVVAEGGVFETLDSSSLAPHGAGRLSVEGSVEADGVFAGDVTVAAGATLAIPASKNILTESEIDAMTSKIARFDPDCEADVDFNNNKTMVHAVFDHGKQEEDNTPYIHATYASGSDRRPTYSRQARGYGPVRGWMDLHADSDSGTKKGNNLRVKKDHTLKHGNDSGSVPLGVKTVFIVMDSCYGGGLPIIDAINPGTIVKARKYSDFTSPIWGNGTSSILTGGETRLNGIAVNGTTTGFTGAPELFSFTTDGSQFNASFFGYYNAGGDQAYEVLGEIVLFSEVLDADTRGGVEAYLMKKWLDTLPSGYVDWTGATVSGAGTVTAAEPKGLPQFDNFTGTLEFSQESLDFTIDCVNGTVAEAFDIGSATLKLADEGVFNLSFKDGIVQPGTYILGSFGTVDGAGVSGWAVTPEYTADDRYRIKVVATTDAELVAKVMPFGMLFIVR